MKHLTKLWGTFQQVPLDINHLKLSSRIFIEKVSDPGGKAPPLYIGVNTLSGSIDLFNHKEGAYLEKLKCAHHVQDLSSIPENFLHSIKNRGYLFPNQEYENFVFDTIIHRYKCEKYSKDKILGFLAIDMGCPVKCKYCFEKKYLNHSDAFENSVMDDASIKAALNFLDLMKKLQHKEIDFVAGWGGEPLLEKNSALNERFIVLAREREMPVAYFSSLVTLGHKHYSILKKYADHMRFLQTTLDAVGKTHDALRNIPGAFEKTTHGIDLLLRANLPVIVRTNVGPHNINLVPALAAFYEEKGWFEFPKFKAFVVKVYDRYHDQEANHVFTEDEALSRWLELKDRFPAMRKMQTLKYAPALLPILKAFGIRESIDITQDNFEVETHPMVTYCHTGNRTEYVFTGAPHYSIYNCAECTGILEYKIGTYYPSLSFNHNQTKLWGVGRAFHNMRSIDTLKMCKTCLAATHCGGYCALEAIVAKGSANDIYCKKVYNVIPSFIKKESARLYTRGRMLMENLENWTL